MKPQLFVHTITHGGIVAALAVLLSCGSSLHAEDIDTANLDSITNAPIIESGRLVGTITNTDCTLNQNIEVPMYSQATRQKDLTMSGIACSSMQVGPNLTDRRAIELGVEPTVKVVKVEDDVATIVPTSSHLPITPAVKVPYYKIKELQGMPHLTDKNPNWYSSEKVLESLEPVKANYVNKFEITKTGPNNFRLGPNFFNIPWHRSSINEWQDLKVPITSELPYGDNSSVVAVANALSYLYTKANTNPTQVSKAWLTWAHDTYQLNDSELNAAWHPNDFVKPKELTEGQWRGNPWPDLLEVKVTSGQEHAIDLPRLLKGVQRQGVALESEVPSDKSWGIPSKESQETAKSRNLQRPIFVRCFNAWNDDYMKDWQDTGASDEGYINWHRSFGAYEAQMWAFVTGEVAKGRPVIITVLRETQPNSGLYIKRSFVITASTSPEKWQAIQVLTPTGRFEYHNYFGDYKNSWGELLEPGKMNPNANLTALKIVQPQVKASHDIIWKNITYAHDWGASRLRSNFVTKPKFEVYSLGLD
jgi:hypothetical protein